MTTEVHLLCYNEQAILPYTLRHYRTFADRIIVHDSFSTDDSRKIATSFGAEVRDWDTGGQINDQLARELKNNCWKTWKGAQADWVVTADADEFIHFPTRRVQDTLNRLWDLGIAVVKPIGWELYSETFPTGPGQIYDEIRMGMRDDYWYGKPILFSPKRIIDMGFHCGAHDCSPYYQSGYSPGSMRHQTPTEPHVYLLHCKHLGPVERIAKEYDEDRKRLAPINVEHGWGNFEPGMKHAQDKRARIKANLVEIIPL